MYDKGKAPKVDSIKNFLSKNTYYLLIVVAIFAVEQLWMISKISDTNSNIEKQNRILVENASKIYFVGANGFLYGEKADTADITNLNLLKVYTNRLSRAFEVGLNQLGDIATKDDIYFTKPLKELSYLVLPKGIEKSNAKEQEYIKKILANYVDGIYNAILANKLPDNINVLDHRIVEDSIKIEKTPSGIKMSGKVIAKVSSLSYVPQTKKNYKRIAELPLLFKAVIIRKNATLNNPVGFYLRHLQVTLPQRVEAKDVIEDQFK